MYLAHDIRTPLTSVIGYLHLLEEDPDMPAFHHIGKYPRHLIRVSIDNQFLVQIQYHRISVGQWLLYRGMTYVGKGVVAMGGKKNLSVRKHKRLRPVPPVSDTREESNR